MMLVFGLSALLAISVFAGFLSREAPIIYWLREQCSWPEGLGLQGFDHGRREIRGVASAKAFAKGEVILAIPEGRLICASTNTNLTLEVVRLKRQASVFSVYLDSLPTLEDYVHWHPFFTSPDILKRFEILPLVQNIRARLQQVNASYVEVGKASGADWDTWQWAAHVVLTRNFGVEGKHCLVPGADLLNAAHSFNVLWNATLQKHGDGQRYFEMKALHDIRGGEEMATTYGAHRTNEQLFWQYGFFMENNTDLITSLDPRTCLRTSDINEIVDRLCDDPSVECGLRRIYIGSCAYSVALAYELGLGQKKDLARAKQWYIAAVSEGDESAREKVELYENTEF